MGSEPLIPPPGGWLELRWRADGALGARKPGPGEQMKLEGGSQKAKAGCNVAAEQVVRHLFAVNGARSPSRFCAWKASKRKLYIAS